MKKFLSVLLVFVMVFAIGVPSVFAEEYVISYGALSSEYADKESTVVYDNPSNFCIMIPETIVANNGYLDFSATYMNLHSNEYVEVYSASGNTVEMNSSETEDIAICLFNTSYNSDVVAKFNNGDLTPEFTVTTSVTNANEIAAAHYEGTAIFRIRLVENS